MTKDRIREFLKAIGQPHKMESLPIDLLDEHYENLLRSLQLRRLELAQVAKAAGLQLCDYDGDYKLRELNHPFLDVVYGLSAGDVCFFCLEFRDLDIRRLRKLLEALQLQTVSVRS